MEKLHVHFAVLVPVGHRVSIVWPEMGGGPHQPVVTDLDTGVVYAPQWAVRDGALEPRRPVKTIVGHVRACLLVSDPQSEIRSTTTHLAVEPEVSPYR